MSGEGKDVEGVGEERSRRGRCGKTGSGTVRADDTQVVGYGKMVPEGAFVAGGGEAVEVEDWWEGTGGIAVFAPGYGPAVWEGECLCGSWHCEAFDILLNLNCQMCEKENSPKQVESPEWFKWPSMPSTYRTHPHKHSRRHQDTSSSILSLLLQRGTATPPQFHEAAIRNLARQPHHTLQS